MENAEIRNEQPEYNWPQLENGLEVIDEVIDLLCAKTESKDVAYGYSLVGANTIQLGVDAEGPLITISRSAFDNWFVFSRLDNNLVLHQVGNVGSDSDFDMPGIIFSEDGGHWKDKHLDKPIIDGVASFMADVYLIMESEPNEHTVDFDTYLPLMDALNDYFDVVARLTIKYKEEDEEEIHMAEYGSSMFGPPPSLN